MRQYLLSFSVLLALLTSCGGQGNGVTDESVTDSLAIDSLDADSLAEAMEMPLLPKAADELFDDFIFNFAANKKLQKERVRFPLPVVIAGKTEMLTKNQWKMEYFFMRQGYYTLLFDNEQHMEVVKDTTVSHAVVEKISFKTERIRQYVFDRYQGMWMLTAIKDIPLSQSNNATFLTFYHQFASDSDFQARHLSSTVKFIAPDPDDDFSQMEGIITPDTWQAFAPQLPSTTIYNIIYGAPEREGNQKVFVMRGIANGQELEMTFHRKGKEWKLTKLTT